MKFWTAQYPMEGQRIFSRFIQHYRYEEKEICFICMGWRDDFCEILYQWFRGEAIKQLLKEQANVMEKVERSLRRLIKEEERRQKLAGNMWERENAIAAFLCVDEEFIAFERGEMKIWCLNTAFGKAHAELLRVEGSGSRIYGGRLEEGVAILLATGEFSEWMREKWLLEGLFVGEMKQEWQMQKRLRELGEEVRHQGGAEVGAVLVKSCWGEEFPVDSKPMGLVSLERGDEKSDIRGMRTEGKAFGADKTFCPIWGPQLGEGAFSKVYQVKDSMTGKIYACKKSRNLAMLQREYCIGEALAHPLFPKIYKFWQENGQGFLLMEYVPGANLKELLERRDGFTVNQTIRVGMALAEGLLYLHEWKYPCLFRDVKPENIVIRQDGRVKLIDMGCICEVDAQGGYRAGSPGFAAPEQLESGKVLDVTCDVYALGKTLEAMFGNGKRKSENKMLRKRKWFVKRRLMRLVSQCTREDPQKRIPDMRWLLLLLGQLQREGGNLGICAGKKASVQLRYWKKLRCLKNIWERSVENA